MIFSIIIGGALIFAVGALFGGALVSVGYNSKKDEKETENAD